MSDERAVAVEQPPAKRQDVHSNQRAGVCGPEWIRSAKWPRFPGPQARSLRVVDLFCGCGGLSLGVLEAARTLGLHPVVPLAVDNDETVLSVYSRSFARWLGKACADDITGLAPGKLGSPIVKAERILCDTCGELDLMVAGPPCQGHSDLNNRTRRSDPRNSLYLYAVRFAEVTRPSAVLIENVPGALLSAEGVVETASCQLSAMGYEVESLIVRSEEFGVAQLRRRHILVAHKAEAGCVEQSLAEMVVPPASLADCIGDIQDEGEHSDAVFRTPSRMTEDNTRRAEYLIANDLYDLPNDLRPPCHRDKTHSYKSMYGRLRWDAPAQTVTTGFGSMGQGRYVHPSRPRVITPHEAARIQGLPDFLRLDGVTARGSLSRMIGNAVPPAIAAHVVLALAESGALRDIIRTRRDDGE